MKRTMMLMLVTLLCACAEAPKIDPFAPLLNKWIGRSVDDLISINGAPPDVYQRDSGGRVFVYFMDQMAPNHKRPRGRRYTNEALIPDATGVRSRTQVRSAKDDVCNVLFEVAANNLIQSWSKEGDGCD